MSLAMSTAQFWLIGWQLLLIAAGYPEEARHPCAFIDTANITGGYNMGNLGGSLNGSYVYNWTVIPKELVTAYDFVIENGIRVPAARHLRACVCKLRPCVRFCCPAGQLYELQRRRCVIPTGDGPQPPGHSHMTVELHNGSRLNLELCTRFSVHVETPCDHMRALTKDSVYLNWTLHEVRLPTMNLSSDLTSLPSPHTLSRRTVRLPIGSICSPSITASPRSASGTAAGTGSPSPVPRRSYTLRSASASGPMQYVCSIISYI